MDHISHAREAAWRIHIASENEDLPIKLGEICRRMGWKLTTYQAGSRAIESLHLTEMTAHTDGFCVQSGGHYYIFIDGRVPRGRQRFTAAHEMGHIILGHLSTTTPTATEEVQADAFAMELLAPLTVLRARGIIHPAEIAHLCDISAAAARHRAKQVQELPRHPPSQLERRAARQFLEPSSDIE